MDKVPPLLAAGDYAPLLDGRVRRRHLGELSLLSRSVRADVQRMRGGKTGYSPWIQNEDDITKLVERLAFLPERFSVEGI